MLNQGIFIKQGWKDSMLNHPFLPILYENSASCHRIEPAPREVVDMIVTAVVVLFLTVLLKSFRP